MNSPQKRKLPGRRVSIRQVAIKANLHHGTVARALRNDPRINEITRSRVVALAKKMGYRPDPELTAMMARVSSKKVNSYQESYAFIAMNQRILDMYGLNKAFQGAKERAERLGYQIKVFFLDDLQYNLRRLSSILLAQGIRGVLFQPLFDTTPLEEFEWNKFASVAIGAPLPRFAIHVARPFHYNTMMLSLEKVTRAGYQRIGFFITEDASYWTNHEWESAFSYYQLQLPVSKRIPIIKLPREANELTPDLVKRVNQWIDQYRIDVVISMCGLHRHLRAMGRRVPEEIGYVELDYHDYMGPVTGIEQHNENAGAAAVDLLTSQIHHRERGIPAYAKTVLINCEWMPGTTLIGG